MLSTRPEATTVTRLQGASALIRLAPPTVKKLLVVSDGPGGITVSVKVCEILPTAAETVTVPAVAPALAVTEARPLPSVSEEEEDSVALPLVTTKLTG